MPLRYALTENPLSGNQTSYLAVPTDNPTVGIEELIDHMISRGSTITRAEALGVYEELTEAVVWFLKSGAKINTGLFTISPSIKGVFDSPNEIFSTHKHTLNFKMRTGSRLKGIHHSIALEKVEANVYKPVIDSVTDLKTGSVNNTITIGQMLSVKGKLLKISGDETQTGIYIISNSSPSQRITQIIKNKPSELLFFLPQQIQPGRCTIEIRTVVHGRRTLSAARCAFELTATL